VILGDGELNEGSIWEACLVAAAKKLDNLVAVVDRNGFQANMKTEELIPLEPLTDKLRAFGWAGREVRGHDFDDLDAAFAALPIESGRPNFVIAHTVRGKGVPSLEGRADRWFARFDSGEVDALIEELHTGSSRAQLGEGMVVR
jgi:transketolase